MVLKEDIKNFKEVFSRLKKKDFSGNTGQAVKNSYYQLLSNVFLKIGSLIFTIVLARIILPERFGLYSLALGTITILTAFTGMGVGESLIKFVSQKLKENKESKAKAYFLALNKFRVLLVSIMSVILLASSYWIANNYYQKPIFLALLAGVLYLPLMSMTAFFESLFMSVNNFKKVFVKEVLFQGLRFIVVISLTLFLLRASASNEIIVSSIILSISLCYLITLVYYSIQSRKVVFLTKETIPLTPVEKKSLKNFLFPLAIITISGIFFGYVDMIMLGYFVDSASIAQYSAAFNLAGSIGTILTFSSLALLPIFSRLKGKSLERGLKKSKSITIFVSIIVAVIVFFSANIIIKLTYGINYLDATIPLKILSSMILLLPLIALYNSYFISQNKTKIMAILLIATTILNIFLNYFFIIQGLEQGMLGAVKGVCYATVISKLVYIGALVISRKASH